MRKAYIKPTKSALIVGIIVISLFLIFGIVFFAVLSQEEGSEIGQGFMIFWMLIVLIIGGSFIYNYINFDKNENITGSVIDYSENIDIKNSEISFDEKLRKLATLKSEGLISDQEYTLKRAEIMNQNW